MSAPTAHLSVPMVVAFHHAGTVTLTMTVGMRKEEQALMNVTVVSVDDMKKWYQFTI